MVGSRGTPYACTFVTTWWMKDHASNEQGEMSPLKIIL